MKYKRNDLMCDPWNSQGNEKNAVSISIAFCLDFLIRNESIMSEECKTRKPFEIILHVERGTRMCSTDQAHLQYKRGCAVRAWRSMRKGHLQYKPECAF